MPRPPCSTRAFMRVFTPCRPYAFHLQKSLISPALKLLSSGHSIRLSSTSVAKSPGGYNWKVIIGSAVGLAAAAGFYSTQKHQSAEPPRSSPSTEAQGMNYASPEELKSAIRELHNTFTEEHVVETNPDVLQQYGSSDNSYHPSAPHSVAIRVQSTEDVVKVVNISRKYRVPITAYSGATSLEGHYSGVSRLFPFFCQQN